MGNLMGIYRPVFLVFFTLVFSINTFGAELSIMAWGTKPTTEGASYINELRHACYIEPEACIDRYKTNPSIKYIAIAFARPEDAEKNIRKAREFSSLSLKNPSLKEIGIDDFRDFMNISKKIKSTNALEQIIVAAKSENKDLKFGVTVYEDDIEEMEQNIAIYPKNVLNGVDRVAFYFHYRENEKNASDYINRIKSIFPGARIYGGAYHYDRIDYISCGQNSSKKCTQDEEKGFYLKTLQMQISFLRRGILSGIEFYPGFFGEENSWAAWKNPRICQTDQLKRCTDISQEMNRETLLLLKQISPATQSLQK